MTRNPAETAAVEGRLKKLDALAKGKVVPAEEIAEEGRRLLSRMPKLKADQELRKDYEKLADGTSSAGRLRARPGRTS